MGPPPVGGLSAKANRTDREREPRFGGPKCDVTNRPYQVRFLDVFVTGTIGPVTWGTRTYGIVYSRVLQPLLVGIGFEGSGHFGGSISWVAFGGDEELRPTQDDQATSKDPSTCKKGSQGSFFPKKRYSYNGHQGH